MSCNLYPGEEAVLAILEKGCKPAKELRRAIGWSSWVRFYILMSVMQYKGKIHHRIRTDTITGITTKKTVYYINKKLG
jgi:hypothetical protein